MANTEKTNTEKRAVNQNCSHKVATPKACNAFTKGDANFHCKLIKTAL